MADRKISDLTALTTPASGDYLPIVDISEAAAASKNKRVTVQSLFQGIPVNVGIGTSSPARALTVNSSSSNINYVRLQENTANTPTNGGSFIELGGTRSDGGYGFYGGIFGGRANLALDNAGYLAFYADNNDGNSLTERMRIDSSGNVGIGTSSPTNQLEVNGEGILRIRPAADNISAELYLNRTTTGGNSYRADLSVDANGLFFKTTGSVNTVPTERLRIDSSGRVGIGASSPDTKLNVVQSSTGRAWAATGGNGDLIVERNGNAGLAIIGATTSYSSLNFGDTDDENAGFIVYYHADDAMAFRTGGIGEDMRIDSSGRVGIGTSSPAFAVDVSAANDAVVRSRTNGNTSAGFIGSTNNGTNNWFIGSRKDSIGGSSGTDRFNLLYDTNAFLTVTETGRVGIGTTSPATPLHVYQNTTGGVSFRVENSEGYFELFANNDNCGYSAAQHIFYNKSLSEFARIDSSGRLLVGTSSGRTTSTVNWPSQIEGGVLTGLGITSNSNDTGGAYLSLAKSRGASVGSNTIVQNGDGLGYILFSGADGNDANTQAALIGCEVDGTPGADDMPGRLVFSTTADGSALPTERLRIDSSGRLLVGASSARSNLYNTTVTSQHLVEVASEFKIEYLGIRNTTDINGANLGLGKSRGTSPGSNTLVQNGDILGQIDFFGSDGSEFVQGALIRTEVDGTPGANDMPGRLVFSTTADGASSPTERMRITSDAYVRLASGTGGIQFNGDTAAANALDDYEEGTWTVSFYDSFFFGNVSATTGTGNYTKVGRLVTATFNVMNVDTTGLTSGNLLHFTLPFSSAVIGVGSCLLGSVALAGGVVSYVETGSRGKFFEYKNSSAYTPLTVADFISSAADVFVTITYLAS